MIVAYLTGALDRLAADTARVLRREFVDELPATARTTFGSGLG